MTIFFIPQVMNVIDSKLSHLFYFTGNKRTTASCPIQLRPSFNPARAVSGYYESNANCDKPAFIHVPFFLARPGPRYVEWSVTAHEARPGHHTEVNYNYCVLQQCRIVAVLKVKKLMLFVSSVKEGRLYTVSRITSHPLV